MKTWGKTWGIALVSMMVAMAPLQAASPFEAAYRVNSSVVTFYEIDQMQRMLEETGVDPKESRERAVNFLIDDRLLRAETERVGLSVEPILIPRTLDTLAGGEGQGEELRQTLRSKGIDNETIDTYISSQILRRSYSAARGGSVISDEEISTRINDIPDNVTQTVSIAEIALPFGAFGGRIPTRLVVSQIRERLAAGESFFAIAREVSAAPTAANGGRLGIIPAEAMNPQLQGLMKGVRPGGLAEPIETENAIILLKLIGYGESRQSLPRSAKVSYVEVFSPASPNMAASQTNARNVYSQVTSCDHARTFSGKNRFSNAYDEVAVNSLSSGISLQLARMEAGTRAIFSRDEGTSVIYLCDRAVTVPEELQAPINNRVITEATDARTEGLIRELRAIAKIVKYE